MLNKTLTSATHPLRVDAFPLAGGLVGMTLCPGRKGAAAAGHWDRDLAADVKALRDWKADIVISLTEEKEMEELRVGDLGGALKAAGIQWIHLPIRDTQAPGDDWHIEWRRVSPRVHQVLEAGGRIVIHCRAGLERTALVAALLQCERGESITRALKVISNAREGAGLTGKQRIWLIKLRQEGYEQRNLARACLFGGAIGDALGAEIEFWSLDRIRKRFPNGVDRILPHDGVPAAITDDTQMSLFTAEGLIRAVIRGNTKGICHPPSVVHHALLRWLDTQGGQSRIDHVNLETGLVTDPRLRRRRAPGLTCLGALEKSRRFGDKARNDSKGCGAVMRSAPVGLIWFDDKGKTAVECAELTHAHPTSSDAVRAFSTFIMMLTQDWSLENLMSSATAFGFDRTVTKAIEAAWKAPADGRPETVESLGQGWVAEEALSIALYAARVAVSFEHGLRIAVTHTGDSDSTGAMAGNLLGILFPDEVLAHDWRRQIECADLIDRLAIDLVTAREPTHEFVESMWDFYPGF